MKLNAEIQQKGQATVQRISCDMPEDEFIEKYVRTMTPVIIHGCDYSWLNQLDLSLDGVTKVK